MKKFFQQTNFYTRSLTILFLFSSFFVFAQRDIPQMKGKKTPALKDTSITNKEKKFFVHVMITHTSSYCGGVRPSTEMLEEINTPKPFAGKKLYVKRGETNTFDSKIFLEISSDTSGKIQLQLPSGKYFIVDEFKKEQSVYNSLSKKYEQPTGHYSAIDTTCLKNWYKQPNLVFEIKNANAKNLTINFNKNCDWQEIPCIQYNGPMPP